MELLKEIRELQHFFTEAQTQLREGNILNLTGMDERISNVCKAAQGAPTEEQKTLLPELTILISLLNAYEQDLRKIQSTLNARPEEKGKE